MGKDLEAMTLAKYFNLPLAHCKVENSHLGSYYKERLHGILLLLPFSNQGINHRKKFQVLLLHIPIMGSNFPHLPMIRSK
jgi:hypothetical protein